MAAAEPAAAEVAVAAIEAAAAKLQLGPNILYLQCIFSCSGSHVTQRSIYVIPGLNILVLKRGAAVRGCCEGLRCCVS